jgi:hypothetical protein
MRSWISFALFLIAGSALAQTTPAPRPEAKPPKPPPAAAASKTPRVKLVEPPKESSFMFVQTAEGGTFTAVEGTDTTRYRIMLSGVGPDTIYFSDRPQRIAGSMEMAKFLRAFPFSPNNPPNAAIVLTTPKSQDADVIVVELTKPVYDAKQRTLSYDVKVLDNAPKGLAYYAEKRDARLPAKFEEVSLFIDDCPDTQAYCYGDYQCSGGGGGEQCCRVNCGTLGYDVGTCWSWWPPGCNVCNDYSAKCSLAGAPCDGSVYLCLPNQCGMTNGCGL